jgi:hypothetical protein
MILSLICSLTIGCSYLEGDAKPESVASQAVTAESNTNAATLVEAELKKARQNRGQQSPNTNGNVSESAQSTTTIVTSAPVSSTPIQPVAEVVTTASAPTVDSLVITSGSVTGTAPSTSLTGVVKTSPALSMQASANSIVIRSASTSTQSDVPIQIGRAFVRGEVLQTPSLSAGGVVLESQSQVKSRWPDGSVKFAVLSFSLPSLQSGQSVTVNIGNTSATTSSVGLTAVEMQTAKFDFDARIKITSPTGATQTASALQMLKNGHYQVWSQGPVATTIVLADHSAARTYDIGFDANRSFRPIFHATFWNKTGKVKVRFAGEISNTQSLQDMGFAVELSTGKVNPVVAYKQDQFTQHFGSRWTKQAWMNGTPPQIGIQHNVGYLAKTMAIPNFDASISVSDQAVNDVYALWQTKPRALMEPGAWLKYMPGAGGRPDIGIITTWHALWLYSGLPQAEEMALAQSDLASAWPMHFREGDSGRFFDRARTVPAIGKPLSLNGRPTMMTAKGNMNIQSTDIKLEDRLNFVGTATNQEWYADGSHQPDPFSVSYLLTGDPWYLEQMQFWASWGALTPLNFSGNNWGRGPTLFNGNIAMLDPRHQAWLLQNRLTAAYFSPDGSSEKLYFSKLVEDALAIFEGMRAVSNPVYGQTPEYAWGAKEGRGYYGARGSVPPIKSWDIGITAYGTETSFNAGTVTLGTATWQQYFMMLALSRAKDYGFGAEPLLKDFSQFLTKMFTDPGVDRAWSAAYVVPVQYTNGQYLTSLSEAQSVKSSTFNTADWFNYWIGNLEQGYTIVAYAAATVAAPYDASGETWRYFKDNVGTKANFAANPKWAILPR